MKAGPFVVSPNVHKDLAVSSGARCPTDDIAMNRSLALLAVAGLMATAIAAPGASARPPRDPNATACSAPTLSGPTAAHVGETYTISACGFAPNAFLAVELTEASGCCAAGNIMSDETGRFTFTRDVWAAGTYRTRISVRGKRGWTIAAQWSFQAS
jgi:hypothetical protein